MSGRGRSHRAIRFLAPGLLPVRSPSDARTTPERVLILRTDPRIGNLVTVTTLLEPLAAAWPRARIDVACARSLADLLAPDPLVHRVIGVDRARLWRDPLAAIRLVRALRAARYDVAIDASHTHAFSTTDALLLRASAAPVRVGFARGDEEACATLLVPPPAPCARPLAYRALLDPLGVPAARPVPSSVSARALVRLVVRDAHRAEVDDWWGTHDGARVLVHVGGRGAKRWPLERWLAAAETLHGAGATVALAGDPAEREELARRAPDGVRAAPALALGQFAALVATADAFVGGDAGPTHVAAALGVPRVVVFLEDTADEWSYGADVVTFRPPTTPSPEEIARAVHALTPAQADVAR